MAVRDDQLISDFLRTSGDIILFKMVYGEFIDLTTDEGIAIFFAKIEEFTEEQALGFDTDAYLNVNSYMVTYYLNDPANKKLPMPISLYGDRINSILTYPRKPSFSYLLSYLRLSNEVSAFVTGKLNCDVNVKDLIKNHRLLKILPYSTPFLTFTEADTAVVDWTTCNLSVTKYEQFFQANNTLLMAWLSKQHLTKQSNSSLAIAEL